MKVKVKLFSIARDIAGFEERELELSDNATVSRVMDSLIDTEKKFEDWRRFLRFAVNHEYVPTDYQLKDGDEVAVIPPVSGG